MNAPQNFFASISPRVHEIDSGDHSLEPQLAEGVKEHRLRVMMEAITQRF